MTATLPATTNGHAVPAIPEAPALTPEILERVMLDGDLNGLNPAQRVSWYRARCEAAGLDPRATPFQYLKLNGKLVLYATKAATDQLTGTHRLSVTIVSRESDPSTGIYIVHARVTFPDGRMVDDCGAVPIKGLQGEPLCNAILKGTTKAKRRAVLSAVGLGMLDESEVDSIHGAQRLRVDDAGEIVETYPANQSLSPPPQNNSGHGRGQYASEKQISQWKAKMEAFIQAENAAWLDSWTGEDGSIPDGIKDLLSIWQVDNHLCRWAVETGHLDQTIIPENVKSRQHAAYVAIVFHRGDKERAELKAELIDYARKRREIETAAFYRKHPELAPQDEQDDDGNNPADYGGDEREVGQDG